MTAIAADLIVIERPKLIVPTSPWIPTKFGIEAFRDLIEDVKSMKFVDKLLKASAKAQILMMSGSDGLWLSQQLAGLVDGGTATTGIPTSAQNWSIGLWTATVDGTMTGATAGETNYGSYARKLLLNSTTLFPAGTTVATEQNQNQWPASVQNFATATSASTNPITFVAKLNGNAGTTADKCGCWASVTSTAIASGDTAQLAANAVTQTRD